MLCAFKKQSFFIYKMVLFQQESTQGMKEERKGGRKKAGRKRAKTVDKTDGGWLKKKKKSN